MLCLIFVATKAIILRLGFTSRELAIVWAKILKLLLASNCLFSCVKIQIKPSKNKQLRIFLSCFVLFWCICFVFFCSVWWFLFCLLFLFCFVLFCFVLLCFVLFCFLFCFFVLFIYLFIFFAFAFLFLPCSVVLVPLFVCLFLVTSMCLLHDPLERLFSQKTVSWCFNT